MIAHFNAAWPWLGPLVVGFLAGVLAVQVKRGVAGAVLGWRDNRRFREIDRKLDIMRRWRTGR